ncbi:ArsR/SmtB family transcription factor [Rhizobiaceae sp. 2RAB30]
MKHQLAAETADMLGYAAEAAEFLKKLANPNRLMIVCALVEGERSVRDLEDTLGIRQPGLSQQIAELREAGFIVGRKESKSVFYSLADGRVAEFVAVMHRLFCEGQAAQ